MDAETLKGLVRTIGQVESVIAPLREVLEGMEKDPRGGMREEFDETLRAVEDHLGTMDGLAHEIRGMIDEITVAVEGLEEEVGSATRKVEALRRRLEDGR